MRVWQRVIMDSNRFPVPKGIKGRIGRVENSHWFPIQVVWDCSLADISPSSSNQRKIRHWHMPSDLRLVEKPKFYMNREWLFPQIL